MWSDLKVWFRVGYFGRLCERVKESWYEQMKESVYERVKESLYEWVKESFF